MEDATSPLLEQGGFGAKPVDADTVRLLDFRSHSVEDRVASTTERYAHNRSAYWSVPPCALSCFGAAGGAGAFGFLCVFFLFLGAPRVCTCVHVCVCVYMCVCAVKWGDA